MRAIISASQAQRTTMQLVNAAALQATKITKAVGADVVTLQAVTTGLDVPTIDASLLDLDARVDALENP